MINGDVQNHGIVPNHDFPRFCRFVGRNGLDTGAILTQNVIPVISVQPILYQLPYGGFFRGTFFPQTVLALRGSYLLSIVIASNSRIAGCQPGCRPRYLSPKVPKPSCQ